jgi:hypothetical protein
MPDRRAHKRYPVSLPVSFKGRVISGSGSSVNLSSKGALILAFQQPKLGSRLELRMNWPALLNGVVGLQLVAECLVTRITPDGFAVEFSKHQFKTVRRPVIELAKAQTA